MSGSRLEAFALERFPKTDWSGDDKPVAIVDGQVIPLSRDVGPLRGSVAWVVGVDDRTFPALCARLRVASLAFYEMRVSDLGPLADYAYLAARLPQVECDMFAPFVPLGQAIGGSDVMVVGKRKPFLNASRDADRLARYVRDFERLQSGFAEPGRSRS